MEFHQTAFEGLYLIKPDRIGDDRGWFARTYCEHEFSKIGFDGRWVQHNHSFTKKKGTIRGMHFQEKPFREVKLVRCIAGVVTDVVIDLRANSSTYLQWFSTELSAANGVMLYVPEGFAHGFQTLSNDCEMLYCHSEFYNPLAEAGIFYADKKINIKWPLPLTEISVRDKSHPLISDNFKGL